VEDRDVLLELATTALEAPALPPSPERLADLEARIRRAVAKGRSEATLRAYSTDWADFATWCRTVGFAPLPAAPGVKARAVADVKTAEQLGLPTPDLVGGPGRWTA
jgi:hypothetical protein